MCLLCIESFKTTLTSKELKNAYREQGLSWSTPEELEHFQSIEKRVELEITLKELLELKRQIESEGGRYPFDDYIQDLKRRILESSFN